MSNESVPESGQQSWKQALMATPGPRSWWATLVLFLKGICMGAADIIPGVSGGTIAFITGIYESLIRAIASFDLVFVKQVFTLKWKTALSRVHLRFLCSLYFGVSLAIFSTAGLMHWLMEDFPVLTWSVFFGLIAGSILIVYREVKRWSIWRGILLAAGAAIAWYICCLIPVNTPTELWFLFLCGIIGICAMILPGISGSFLLLVLGKYYYITGCLGVVIAAAKRAVLHLDFSGAYALVAGTPGELGAFWALVAFQCGQLCGIVGFTRFLKWLLAKWHEGTMCVLAGMMIGAMRKIWPWKHELEVNRVFDAKKGIWSTQTLQEVLVWPWNYAQDHPCQVHTIENGTIIGTVHKIAGGLNPQIALSVLLIAFGFALVLLIEYLAHRNDPKTGGDLAKE